MADSFSGIMKSKDDLQARHVRVRRDRPEGPKLSRLLYAWHPARVKRAKAKARAA